MIPVSNDNVRSIGNDAKFLSSGERGHAAVALGLFTIANALETGLVAIAKALASRPNPNVDSHKSFD